ncbi:MAG: tRNA uridine-5-carboxymethylaminomethyl(34) synthesis enzyme MnmG [Clostridiales bacterium 43-6]|nr:MAG: tRNA uridine-5-carboxymethylaminomethyl(34) synthesis enzyme MnmG [Clostridiales bacterium 43-6]
MKYNAGQYDVIVIGAGHAGIEAALASSRLSCKTIVFTMNLDSVGNLPCNPSIGGTAKGHLVCEIDALGGEMGKAADATFIQSRMLNTGKGQAVHSLRAQIDRRNYASYMKYCLEKQENLELKQAEIVEIDKNGKEWIVTTHLNGVYHAKTVIIATGTFLTGKVYVGEVSYPSGPDGMFPATRLGEALKTLGLPLRRFKTGTPARVNRGSIDFTGLEIQEGDDPITPFSYNTETPGENKVVCHITWTNEKTKDIILENLHRSPLYAGQIEGVGPRYCPSIEDKIVRFADKERHQIFIEPCGLQTEEMYLQGVSSSLPEEVQIALYRTVKGLEKVQIMRNAYAIEYDSIDPTALQPTLEVTAHSGLYGAGQFNGSSGYEEAAAQGLVAGINAARKVKGLPPFVLQRSSSYIGTLIDDLVTKGCTDPYRMMTSRSEYRLLLRQDNADERLMPFGREIGLIDDEQWQRFSERLRQKEAEIKRLESTYIKPSAALNELLVSRETSPVASGVKLADLIRRPQISHRDIKRFDETRPQLAEQIFLKAEVEIKYAGYIKRQLAHINEQQRLEERKIPEGLDYHNVVGLRKEAVEKLAKVMPYSIGQASRISGVSPADISVLLIYLDKIK